jgi:hypothetical protein
MQAAAVHMGDFPIGKMGDLLTISRLTARLKIHLVPFAASNLVKDCNSTVRWTIIEVISNRTATQQMRWPQSEDKETCPHFTA